jgi:cell pole-organizing protein PopZ
MEEILASIRRIIADDEAKPASKPQEVATAPAPAAVAEKPAPAPRPVAPPPPRPVPVAEVKPVAPPPPPAPPPPSADVLDLTEAMAAPPPPPPAPSAFRTIDGQSDVVFSDRAPDPVPSSLPPEPAIRAVEEARKQFVPDRNLLSATTANAVDSAFNSLARTVLGNNARTLEDLVKEMLRPMLKSWLDDNLPGLVDRIVRAEIERVSRGR